ncbi:hypothetical protein SAMN00120144_4003 [Hymenobacter roseosalivarius DSM 11622]|uniref:Uncharacterized protein n=1 Tax=Hymenobacter roseosalivarius DSM 11622 TaxID=645990 RepID=A0A1W1UI87_9BACT|nr:hypothetical protein SAMN00120144_4003 [Hymenobacter roseosalivarius DSM 11622]
MSRRMLGIQCNIRIRLYKWFLPLTLLTSMII